MLQDTRPHHLRRAASAEGDYMRTLILDHYRKRLLHWINAHRASLFLSSIVMLIAINPIMDAWNRSSFILAPAVALLVVGTIHHTRKKRSTFFIVLALALGWLVSQPELGVVDYTWVSSALLTALLFTVLLLVGRKTLIADEVNLETISAAMAGYLIIGCIWSNIYLLISAGDPGAFSNNSHLALNPNAAIYFSLQTLTTLGSGDILPVNPFARILTAFEAVTGQFYVAIVIARLITLLPPPNHRAVFKKKDTPPSSTHSLKGQDSSAEET
ncbi:potassium channel family protein [Acidocella aminolytica]|uniref:potassium channel family protein n=2 Tax=Acidocella aminolytica TaxID=33998 RepID=UPI00222FFE08|nr:potassium channel family protein [Acidocella aminolytica]